MSNNLKKYSFNDLLRQGKLRIPKIQRDYAQGRKDLKVNTIRKEFVHTLLLVVKGKRSSTELDFVYGSNQKDAFEPLDGQQRLTTLFLLHWMFGVKLSIPGETKHSLFTYETRNTSDEFCDEIVQHNAIQLVKEAHYKKKTPSEIIMGRDWFKWEWKYDPTILSMLVMIDAIDEEMGNDWNMDMTILQTNLDHITFNLLNLGDFGLSNELFIKMNARGKQLSDFDKLKSTLEEELQIQQKENNEHGEPIATPKNEEMWRSLMDGPWIDFFWHKYARTTINKTESDPAEERKKKRLDAAKFTELQFKKLLLRLIALQLFANNGTSEKLCEAAYNIEEAKIDYLMLEYIDSLVNLRSDDFNTIIPSSTPTINYKQLIEDVNLLIYKDDKEQYKEISDLLPQITHIDNDDKTLFDSFLDTKVPNDVELIFYSMLLFLRDFPAKKIKETDGHDIAWVFEKNKHPNWLKNFEDWVRFTRNILLNNNNNQRIDKILFSKEATQSLKQLSCDFYSFVKEGKLDLELNDKVVKLFLISSDNNYQRIDNQSLAEERLKAKLILDNNEWEKSINEAERNPYLWGQIRCLLNWSSNDLMTFKAYSSKLLELLEFISDSENARKYYTAMLVFAPHCWYDGNRLYQYNKTRDNSFKRYLREHSREKQAYGFYIKELIDLWKREYDDLSVNSFFDTVIQTKVKDSEPWIQCVVKNPKILDEAWNKRIFIRNGHPILAQRLTVDSHCFDPILVYFRNKCKEKDLAKSQYKLYDSKGDYEHAFELEKESHIYLIRWGLLEGQYAVKTDDSIDKELSPTDLINYVESII